MGLFTPKWLGNDQKKAQEAADAAIRKDDQRTLARIAVEAVSQPVRVSVLKHLKDQALLEQIATTDPDEFVCAKAIDAVTDPAVLERILNKTSSSYLQGCIVDRITDQDLLLKIAKSGANQAVRQKAVRGIKDEAVLRTFAFDRSAMVKKEIIPRISDQKLLADMVRNELDARMDFTQYSSKYDPHMEVAAAALERITNDQQLFADVIVELKKPGYCDGAVRCLDIATKKLVDKDQLYRLIKVEGLKNGYRWKIAQKVADRLTQDDYLSLAMGCTDALRESSIQNDGCYAACDKLTDQDKLVDLANNAPSIMIRIRAMQRIKDKSRITFRVARADCKDHDSIPHGILRDLQVIGREWQCPFCGEPLTNCNYGLDWNQPIKDSDKPAALWKA